MKVTLLRWCFSRFLNCTASHIQNFELYPEDPLHFKPITQQTTEAFVKFSSNSPNKINNCGIKENCSINWKILVQKIERTTMYQKCMFEFWLQLKAFSKGDMEVIKERFYDIFVAVFICHFLAGFSCANINPLMTSVPILYPLKTSEKPLVFLFFSGGIK